MNNSEKFNLEKKNLTVVDTSRIFAKLIFEEKMKVTLKFIRESNDSGLLPTTPETVAQLKLIYPEPAAI